MLDMHIAPGAYLGESVDIIVGNIHSAGISYFAVDDCNLPMVAVSRMIDIRELERIEFYDFDPFSRIAFRCLFLSGLLFDQLPNASNIALL